jgi:hypothetical protein
MTLRIDDAVWGLIEGTLELPAFEIWVNTSETLKADVGAATHIALLETQYCDAEAVLQLFQPWAEARYGHNVDLVRSYRIISLCRKIMECGDEMPFQVRKLLGEASDDHRYAETDALWRDEAWGALAQIDDQGKPLPVGIDPALVAPELMARMKAFAEEVRPDVIKACGKLVTKYGRASSG